MEQRILKDFDYFNEYPDGILLINSDSNLFYTQIDGSNYIVRESLENFTSSGTNLIYKRNYYDILNKELVFSCEYIKSLIDGKTVCNTDNIKLIKLSDLLSLKGDAVSEFDRNDIINLIGFKEEKSNNPRKDYF